MSILFKNDCGYYISHKNYVNKIYEETINTKGEVKSVTINNGLFKILTTYKTNKNKNTKNIQDKEVLLVKNKYNRFILEINVLLEKKPDAINNQEALKLAEQVYKESGNNNITNAFGTNPNEPAFKEINESSYLFPKNSTFYCKDVLYINEQLKDKTFDLILLDPPWWNKYIRRKRKHSSDAYSLMYNTDLKNIPIEDLLDHNGMVVVWCTNCKQHLDTLINEIFPKWRVIFVAKWFWLKITTSGEPVCSFSEPPGKQPYEQIIFGYRGERKFPKPEKDMLVLSVPSAIHSHKPPLVELMKPFLPENPKCLEIFARYLLPNWTSYGNEALKLQHGSLYNIF